MAAEPLLNCRALEIGHAGKALLPPLDLTVGRGEFWAVLGKNGAGKSTWLKTVLGLLQPVSGSVSRAPGLRLSYVPQRAAIDELYPLSAREVVRLGVERGWSFLAHGRAARDEATTRALDEVAATALAHQPFSDLSEGQKQRILFARMLASRAELALLDEPTSAMDEAAEREAFELLDRLRLEHGLTIVIVSHYIGLAAEFADHVLVLDRDRRAAHVGTPREALERSGLGVRSA
jgi:zinc transport system ATP-binding protein